MVSFDLAVAGAGILGLAHAFAAARRGLRVIVLERDARAASASIRNFGFVTIAGQEVGETRRRALRSREVWDDVAREAGIAVEQRGAIVVARRVEALDVLREYAASDAGGDCAMWDAKEARSRIPGLRGDIAGALRSEPELRVAPREALPRLAAWLEKHHRVAFAWDCPVVGIGKGVVRHPGGTVSAESFVACPGTAVAAFDPGLAQRHRVRQCKLQMLRIAPPPGAPRLPGVVMTDLSLLRYGGFAAQPSARRLRERLEQECAPQLANGVHLIVAQGGDGSLVVGDSHHEAGHADPFAREDVDALIMDELRALLDFPVQVAERWLGHYPVADVRPVLRAPLGPRAQLVTVTSGTGMSTAFAIGEETIAGLFG